MVFLFFFFFFFSLALGEMGEALGVCGGKTDMAQGSFFSHCVFGIGILHSCLPWLGLMLRGRSSGEGGRGEERRGGER